MGLPARLILPILALALLTFSRQTISAADGTPPVITSTISGTVGQAGWYTSTVAVTLRAEDLESGVGSITYTLDGAAPVTEQFVTGSNLAPNPSFEVGTIDGWTVGGSASFTQDSTLSRFDLSSARIVSTDTGFKFWTTQSGIPLTAGKTYTLTVWTKYSQVVGAGIKLALGSATSTALTGTGDWTRLSLTFTPASDGTFQPQLGIDGPGQVNFDGVYLAQAPFPAEVGFVVSNSGNHTISFTAANNDGTASSAEVMNFKNDTQGPSNWRNIRQLDGGNDHTFRFTADVSDNLSGLATGTGQYQYSLDGGATWGHYENLTSCNSAWLADGWVGTSQTPSGSGLASTTMSTPNTDFCDSNFAGCEKKIRLKIEDVAGNFSSREQCLNSAWFSSSGDLYSVGSINPASPSEGSGWIGSGGFISNLNSPQNWFFPQFNLDWNLAGVYGSWRSYYYGGAQALPGGKLPGSGVGYYKVTSSFTVDKNTLPASFAAAGANAVIFVDGNLSVNSDFSLPEGSAYVFVVSGDILVDGGVQNMGGIYLSQGKFDDHNGGPTNNPLKVLGAVWVGGGFNLERDLGKSKNTATPAEKFDLPAGVFVNSALKELLAGETQITWFETDGEDEGCGP